MGDGSWPCDAPMLGPQVYQRRRARANASGAGSVVVGLTMGY